ncbi:Mbeg1-like protein [Nitrosomonas sp.]|uniref:poly(ethylene terephthalate) hydrolase family protein n=1 Tax=Nitrosomonas sp. TaxID=42353 RepID=UPI001DBFCCEF|nr:Mbeg1-like protein [Nitrosomonas sp.]MCB1949645.1 DUF2974 domain-containing protein [Nitrosomonas sp.]
MRMSNKLIAYIVSILIAISTSGIATSQDTNFAKVNNDSELFELFIAPDPVTQTSYSCYWIHNYNWNYGGDGIGTITGKIRFPLANCNAADGPPEESPVMIFMHGNGMDYNDHSYLMAHLARNGIITVSIVNGEYMSGSNEGRAREAISYLNSLNQFWKWRHRLSNKVVFAGHSRGGEAAITAARLLSQESVSVVTSYNVKAVISIAPTDGGGIQNDLLKEDMDGDITKSFLGLYGSLDPDVKGTALEEQLSGPESTVFAIYDRAGTESSVEGFVLTKSLLEKSLVYIDGATHQGFLKSCNFSTGGTIGCSEHRDIAKGYFNAFLRWQLFNETIYRTFFDGTATPLTVSSNNIELLTQYSSSVPRRVIDNFEQKNLRTNTKGGEVLWGKGIAQIAKDELWQLDESVPHDSRGIRIKWSNEPSAYVRWEIPLSNIPYVGSTRDVTRFGYLSFRVAQNYQDAWNIAGRDQDFYVLLRTRNGYSNRVLISDFGRIPYPFNGPLVLNNPSDYTKTAMSTIRIPLSAFKNADLSNVYYIYFIFDEPNHEMGSIIVDSLEFSR